MKKSHYLISILVLLIASCAGTESYQKKMERYTARSGERTIVPEIKSADIKFAGLKPTKRTPASIMSGDAITNKKLYFLSLYAQYETLKTITNNSQASGLNLCPSFHTGLVIYQEKHPTTEPGYEKKYSYKQTEFTNEKYVSVHPELYLPVTKEGTTPRVIDILRSMNGKGGEAAITEVVQSALNLHLAKTYTELRELCDYGSSNNYYIYENLITHIKNTSFPASTENMNILLKTTLFSNRSLITSLAKDKPAPTTPGRSIASLQTFIPYTDEVVARLNVPWSNEYFSYIKETK